MSDTVKFIFKTLLRVPILIIVAYVIFNIFVFGLSYFKMLGLSYVALQTAVENNYIPPEERTSLERYMQDELQTEILQNVSFTPDSFVTPDSRVQYGNTVTIGVQAHYKFLWPLQPKEQFEGNEGVEGWSGSNNPTGKSEAELEEARNAYDSGDNNIVIEYHVPGLKYYPDLDN